MRINKSSYAYFMLLCLLCVTYFIYSQGLGGALYYDDFGPLSGLANISDMQAKWSYVLGDISGPLGRPISMLSFLLNKDDWPNSVHNILHFNVILHCVNAGLVFFLCKLLVVLGSNKGRDAGWPALLASGIWMLSPLLVSTSLIAVQRMAGLSAFFVLTGLISYLVCFLFYAEKVKLQLIMQAFFVGLFTVLAMLSKENGVLLPVFALVVELVLLRDSEQASKFRVVRIIAFSICLLIVFGYIISGFATAEQDYLHRSYSIVERLLTQPVILLDYLRMAFLPDIFSYSPFHDNYQYFSSVMQWQVFVSIAALSVFVALAFFLQNKYKFFCFAVFWFLAAHLLESTSVSLELFFEHRNYVALIGPCLAIAVGISEIPVRYQSLTKIITSLYFCLLGFSSYQVASIWGEPQVAGKIWFESAKGSARAAEHYAIQLLEANEPEQAYLVLQRQAENCSDCIGSQIQAMQLSCKYGDTSKTDMYYQRALDLSGYVKNLGSAPSSLAALMRAVNERSCTHVDLDDLERLNLAVLPNTSGSVRLTLLVNLHQIAHEKNDTLASIDYLRQAWQIGNNRTIGQMLAGKLIEEAKFDEAQDFIDKEMCVVLPKLSMLRKVELDKCNLASHWLADALAELEDEI